MSSSNMKEDHDMLTESERWKPGSHWDNHPEFLPRDWIYEVQNGDTRQGYADWVNHQLEVNALEEGLEK